VCNISIYVYVFLIFYVFFMSSLMIVSSFKKCWNCSEAEVTVLTPLGDKRVVEKQDVSFECVFSKPDKPATWSKKDKPIAAADRIQIGVDGARHFLTIKSAVLDDEATYKIQVEKAVSAGKLIVEG